MLSTFGLLLGLFYPVFFAFADPPDCGFIRLDQKGGSMEHVFSKTQDKLNDCAARVGSDMVDAWRFSHGPSGLTQDFSDLTSHIEAAIGHKARSEHRNYSMSLKESMLLHLYGDSDKPYEWNMVDGIVKYLKKHGRCDARFFAKPDERMLDYQEYLLSISTLMKELRANSNLWSGGEDLAENYAHALNRAEVRKQVADEMSCKLAEAMPKVRIPDIEKILSEDESTLNLLYEIYSKGCPKREPIDVPDIHAKTIRNEKELKELLTQNFDHSEVPVQPIGVGYCGGFLFKGIQYAGVLNLGIGKVPSWGCKPHASLVIGRRFNSKTNRCEVLIRNTWGFSPGYSSDFEKDGSLENYVDIEHPSGDLYIITDSKIIEEYRNKGAKIIPRQRTVPNGDVWVPMDAFSKNIFEVYAWDLPH